MNYEIEYKNTAIVGVRPGAKVFTIEDKKFHIPWDKNKEVEPFIMSNKKFYFIYARNFDEMNLDSVGQLYDLLYKEVDLTEQLK